MSVGVLALRASNSHIEGDLIGVFNKKDNYHQKPLLILCQPTKSAKATDLNDLRILNDLRMTWRDAGEREKHHNKQNTRYSQRTNGGSLPRCTKNQKN